MAVTGAIATRTHDEQNAQLTPKWRRVLPATAVVATYLVLGLVAYWPVVPEISHHIFSSQGDMTLFVWCVGWVPHALTHGLNPFYSNAMFAPIGLNLAQTTEAPLLGLIAAPFTLGIWPSGLDEPVDCAGHADLGDRRVRGAAQVAGVGSGSCAGWADLWILALHGGPKSRPSISSLCTAAAFHRDDSRFDLAASGSTSSARDPARPLGCGPIPYFAGGTGHCGRPHRRSIGVCRVKQPVEGTPTGTHCRWSDRHLFGSGCRSVGVSGGGAPCWASARIWTHLSVYQRRTTTTYSASWTMDFCRRCRWECNRIGPAR